MIWIIIAICIAILIIISSIIIIINIQNRNNKSKADSIISILLKSNTENYKKCLQNIITNIDMSKYQDYLDEGDKYNAIKNDINVSFSNESYEILIRILNDSLQKKEIKPAVYTIIIKTLTHEMVDNYILDLFDNLDIKDMMIDLYNKCLDNKINHIELEDSRINEEFWLPEENVIEKEVTVEQHNDIIDEYMKQMHLNDMSNLSYKNDNGELIQGDERYFKAFMGHDKIIPPKEIESDVIEDDGSVEIIEWLEDNNG